MVRAKQTCRRNGSVLSTKLAKYSNGVEQQVWKLSPPGQWVDFGSVVMRFAHFSLCATLSLESSFPVYVVQYILLYSICLLEICMQMAISDADIWYHIFLCFFPVILKSIQSFIPWAKNIFHPVNRRNCVTKCRLLNPKNKFNLLALIISQILMERSKEYVQQNVSFLKGKVKQKAPEGMQFSRKLATAVHKIWMLCSQRKIPPVLSTKDIHSWNLYSPSL